MILKVSHRLAVPKKFSFFNKFTLNLKHDAIASSFGFEFYFDPTNKDHAELYAVSHFHEATLEHNGETLVRGFMTSEKFTSKPKRELVGIGGYSKTGVLEDCQIPPSIYPLQISGVSFSDIARKLCAPFKLNVVIDPDVQSKMDAKIENITFEPTATVKDCLTKIAVQRKIIMTHNSNGDLYFTQAKTNSQPIIDFTTGTPGTTFELMFDGQKLHSDITVMKEMSTSGGNSGQHTIENPFVPVAYTYRPRVVTQTSGDDVTIQEYAKQILLAEIKSAITLTITTDRWEIDGKIIKPNSIVSVYNPEVFLYKTVKWFVEEITFTGDESKTTAVLKCVLPCCYDNTIPKNIFVDAHENFPRFNYTRNNNSQSVFI